ncbi:MAG: hypothetical protein V8Q84_03320 [Bilophila sp.]
MKEPAAKAFRERGGPVHVLAEKQDISGDEFAVGRPHLHGEGEPVILTLAHQASASPATGCT